MSYSLDGDLQGDESKMISEMSSGDEMDSNSIDGISEINYNCICPCCGVLVSREKKNKCSEQKCPECGTMMIRNWYD